MSVIENKNNARKIKSVAQKLEAIKQIANIVLSEDDPLESRNASNSGNINFYEEIERFEAELIVYALNRANGHQRRAAEILNIKPSTLNAKLKRLNLISIYTTLQTKEN